MKRNAFSENLYKSAGYYTVALISLIYVASSLVLISKTGKSVYEIIGTGFLSLVVGSLINGAFRTMGIRRGEEDERTVSTIALHSSAVEEIVPYIDRLDEYCENENKNAIKRVRTKILAKAGLKYDECFDENGVAKEISLQPLAAGSQQNVKKLHRQREKAYKQAVNLKIKRLLSSDLTSDGGTIITPLILVKASENTQNQEALPIC